MDARILELIKSPEIINFEDLKTLESEIKMYPYIQNFRALYLYGINKLVPENYQAELSKTAAYTTDKKILYQFINGKIVEKSSENLVLKEEAAPIPVLDNFSEKTENQNVEEFSKEEIVDINNFENEELKDGISFHEIETLNTENQIIGSQNFDEAEDSENFSKEEIINEDKIAKQNSEIENSAEIDFHGIGTSFLPEVKLGNNSGKLQEAPKQNLSRHDDEMQRLIAEVEAKMKSNSTPKIFVEENHGNRDISFAETHDFVPISKEKEQISTKIEQNSTKIEEIEEIEEIEKIEKIEEIEKIQEAPEISISPILKEEKVEVVKPEIVEEKVQEVVPERPKQEWKPMQISSSTPDSLLAKKSEISSKIEEKSSKIEENSSKIEKIQKSKISEKPISEEEIPVMNVSFFSQNVSSIEKEDSTLVNKSEEKIEEKPEIQEVPKEESNVPHFINTWQSWLKIDRKETKKEEVSIPETVEIIENQEPSKKEEIKAKVIENFIENEPKISKLKEDSDFVVKDKGDNISHLMTETLAKLYIEQKLYSKAIKAYETLILKHPEKSEEFISKIQEIKELRSKG